MPYLFKLPGSRDGPDNIFEEQRLEGGVLEIAASTRIYSSIPRLYWTDHSGASVINHGTIWNISPSNSGAIVGFYVSRVENYGLIVSEAPNGNATAIFVGSGGPLVRNHGLIYAIANGNAQGIAHWDPDAIIVNNGVIAAYAPTASEAGVGDAVGLVLHNGGIVDNNAGASILAEGLTATALIFGRGTVVNNAGRVEAHAIDSERNSHAILTAALTSEEMRIENSGIIRADIAYLSQAEFGFSPPQQPADRIHNHASGEIHGLIDTRLGHDVIANAGLIVGDILTGEGDDLVDTTAGTFQGRAILGWGEDRFLGSAGHDRVAAGRDSDSLEGGGGDDLLLGGLGDDVLGGGAGNDGLYGEHGDDRIVTASGDRVSAGDGDDVVMLGDLAFRSIEGGAGFDWLVLPTGGRAIDLAAVRATGRVTGIEGIELSGDQRIVVRAGDSEAFAGEAGLWFKTGPSDRIELIGAWREGSAIAADGLIYRLFTLGDEVALVAGRASVAILGAPSAPAGSLDAPAGSAVPPLPDADLDTGTELSSTTTILSNYRLHDTETVQSYETWRSDDGQPILWTYGLDYALINYGLMESIGPGNGGAKIAMLWGIDRIENHGTMRAVGTGAHYADAIVSNSHGGVINHGLIEAVAEDGRAVAVMIGGRVWNEFNFINTGTISARTNGAAPAVGAIVFRDDNAVNHGLISAVGGDGSTGLQVSDQRQFTNTGTIVADLAGSAGGSTTGMLYVASGWGSTFVNRGLIRGTKAIEGGEAAGTTPGPTVFYNFGRLEGTVGLGSGHSRFENIGVVTGEVKLGDGRNFWFGAEGLQLAALFAGDGTDIVVGSAGANILGGDGGDDYLVGGGGADRLTGGGGRDVFAFAATSDSTPDSFDTITDFASGDDRIDLSALTVQSVSLTAEGTFTRLVATTPSGLLSVRIEGTVAQSDLILAYSGTGQGTAADDLLMAGRNGSALIGGEGNDTLVGSAAGDRLEGGAGLDLLWGGAGNDVYVLSDPYDPWDMVWETIGQGIDTIELSALGQLLQIPDNVENVVMFERGFVRGNGLANTVHGSDWNDGIEGGAGNDLLHGGKGDDRIEGGAGADRMSGGDGADIFMFITAGDSRPSSIRSDGAKVAPDVIADFESGIDRISLIDVRHLEGGARLFDSFTFVGTAAFSSRVGEVRYDASDGHANLFVDLDGDAVADMQIFIATDVLTAADFIL